MLAPTGWTPEKAIFPYLATPKIDGIRFYTQHGDVWTRSNKCVPNLWIRKELPSFLPDGIDGELFYKSYSQTVTEVMTEGSSPEVDIYIFDYVPTHQSLSTQYIDRMRSLKAWMDLMVLAGWKRDPTESLPTFDAPLSLTTTGTYRICPLYPTWVKNHEQLEAFYQKCLSSDLEGICLRSPQSPYRFGRCTLSENYLLKYKPVEDREARILGVEELMSNTNQPVLNETGRRSRSTTSSGLVPAGTFGAFHVRDTVTEIDFRVGGGPGLTGLLRNQLWSIRHDLPGRIIKYRSMPYGVKEKPRQPQFLGFRDPIDM